MKTSNQQPQLDQQNSSHSSFSGDSPSNTVQTKNELLAKLNDMKSAIDSYKEYKSKQTKDEKRNPSSSRPQLQNMFKTTSQRSLQLELTEAPCQVSKHQMEHQRPIFSPTSQASDAIRFGSSEKCVEQPSLNQYLAFNTSEKVIQESIDVQCDLSKQEISELKEKHSDQLQLFDSQINQLRESMNSQQSREANLVEAISLLQGEIEILKQSKEETESREEELMKQSEELILVVEEQTEQLKEKDKQIEKFLENEQMNYDRQLQSSLSSPRIKDIDYKQMQEKNHEMKEQIEELKEKLANEFNKKRKMKCDYDDQIVEMNEELEYYKDKYNEMKNLLSNCRDQLKQFEELNQMRNDVIEKLEGDNKLLKDQVIKYQNMSSVMAPNSARRSYQENYYSEVSQTPSRKYNNNSFSLHLQKVQLERSSDKCSFGQRNDFGIQGIENRKRSNCESSNSKKPPMPGSEYLSPQNKMQDNLGRNQKHQHESITCIEENVQAENMGDESFKAKKNKKHQRSSCSLPQAFEHSSHSKKLSQYLSPNCMNLKTEQPSGNCSLDTSLVNGGYANLHKRDSGKENRVNAPSDYLTEQKSHYVERNSYQFEPSCRPFRVLSTENRQYQFSERGYGKKPFEYQSRNPYIQNQTVHSGQELQDSMAPMKHLKTACFAHQETTVDDNLIQTDDSINLNKSSVSDRLSNSVQKASIRDEIKKLHNNINSLRQKMCQNQSKSVSKPESGLEKKREDMFSFNPQVSQ